MNVSRLALIGIRNSSKVCLKQRNSTKFFASLHYINEQQKPQIRQISTVESKAIQQKDASVMSKILNKIPFLDIHKTKLMAAGYLLYEGIADKINYIEFFEELELPDTFYSWFVLTELHIWMISVRVMAEGDDGRHIRNSMIEALWADVAQRVKQLGAHNPSATRAQISELSEQLQAALIAYDEGLQSDDTVLAGALWRRLYQQQDVNPICLDILVRYIRRHIRLLDNTSAEELVKSKTVNWDELVKHQ